MAGKVSAPVIILIILTVISLSLAGGGYYLFQNERAKTQDLQIKLEELSAKQITTEAKLRDSEKTISETKARLQEAQSQIDTLKTDLQNETSARQEAMSRMDQLRSDLEAQKKSRADLEKSFTQAQNDLSKTQEQLRLLELKKSELENKVNVLEEKSKSVELGKIVVNPPVIAEPVPEVTTPKAARSKAKKVEKTESAVNKEATPSVLEGKVLVVNKEYNFTVINLGTKEGVRTGDVFSVFHSDKYIGDVKVEKVHDSMSAAGFLSNDIKDKVSEGDKVLQKGK